MLLVRFGNSISLECIYVWGPSLADQPYRPLGLTTTFSRSGIFWHQVTVYIHDIYALHFKCRQCVWRLYLNPSGFAADIRRGKFWHGSFFSLIFPCIQVFTGNFFVNVHNFSSFIHKKVINNFFIELLAKSWTPQKCIVNQLSMVLYGFEKRILWSVKKVSWPPPTLFVL